MRPLVVVLIVLFTSLAFSQNDPGVLEDPSDLPAPVLPVMPAPTVKPLPWQNIPEIKEAVVGQPRIGLYAGWTRLVFDVPKGSTVQVTPEGFGITIGFSGLQVRGGLALKSPPSSLSPEVQGWSLSSGPLGSTATIRTRYPLRAGGGGWKMLHLPAGLDSLNDRLVLDFSEAFANRQTLQAPPLQLFPFPVEVVLDPGHGGKDPGAVGSVMEKEVNLQVTHKVQGLLEAAGATVVLTRLGDTVFSDDKRTDLQHRASLGVSPRKVLVSIHANSLAKQSALAGYGVETWWHPNHPESQHLARTLQSSMLEWTSAFDRKVRTAPFVVIRNSQVPAALIEMGFVSHPVDGENLLSAGYLDRMAYGIALGIQRFVLSQAPVPSTP
ncbi:N-acetylmuramoyl-L-alanine amidase family protein [Deinococcus cellulosilyticus]|uniref:MurNAc-LAA domain-containing protein n=1 Tax=Deinococcus cellulosilyticus (strain DSM 18568 / NBRC 106333 / KACC 11606 / 5516J-15) TaxID=1223518 RepID=A0A511MYK8_DEIC1|nr:N-acetylmuramoyl-L-alanine amidase [Deinococcus cellulosilyticus]GEM45684.1 hypothetical protein DC3_13190 [Deinococcus cellulosilyticus NBRC 106333 = KACC 11606]